MKSSLRILTLFAASITTAVSLAEAQAPWQSAFRALSGEQAAGFSVPADMELVRSFPLAAYGLTYERYQQYFGNPRAEVLGAQITVYRDSAGVIALVVGSHYRDITPTSIPRFSAAEASAFVDRDIGASANRKIDLLIDPLTGRYFHRVETRRFNSRWMHWIDAASGRLMKRYDALATDHGLGVKSDTKDMNGPDDLSTDDDLTTFHSASGHGASTSHWDLFSKDNRQFTYDARNGTFFLYYVTDADNHWTTVTSERQSPGQPALVDAQYYANLTDDYFLGQHGFNWLGCGYTAMQSVAHYSRNYNNAFWNGTYTVYGDGDGITFRELSGGLDVVSHESTHGVTDCTSALIYQDEPGALNESFSDILGTSAEFYAEAIGLDPAAAADWSIGEDVYLPADTVGGFRNLADPAEDGDPDHYLERQIGGGDNGGVHSNSGIPNHAYYLLANGGQNAGCDGLGSNGHTHTADCEILVSGIGLASAERIFFLAFNGLSSGASMSQARDATVAVARSQFPSDCQSVVHAWQAVGVSGSETCPVASNTPPVADDRSAAASEDSAIAISLTGSDAEQCELAFSIVSGPAHGSLSGITPAACASGTPNTDSASITYTPNPNFNGSDSFTYRVNDGSASGNPATVSITVNAVNDAPEAADQSATTSKDSSLTVSLSATDVDNCELIFSIVSGPSKGSLGSISDAPCSVGNPNSDGASVTYTPSLGFTGNDSFTYEADDGSAVSNLATVFIAINETNTLHVGNLDGQGVKLQQGYWKARVTVAVHDKTHNPAPGATVNGSWRQNGTLVGPGQCTTGSDGTCIVDSGQFPSKEPKASFTVDGVIHPSLSYSAAENHDPDGSSNGTTVAISK